MESRIDPDDGNAPMNVEEVEARMIDAMVLFDLQHPHHRPWERIVRDVCKRIDDD